MQSCGKLGPRARSRLPALERGRRSCQKSRDLTRKRDQIMLRESTSKNQPQRVSQHSGTPLGVGTSHRHFDTQDSPRPELREATTFPHVVFSAARGGGYTQMALSPGTPKLESRNCPCWSPGTLEAHNSQLQSLIATRSKPKLQPLLRSFQCRVALYNRILGRGQFLTFNGRESN